MDSILITFCIGIGGVENEMKQYIYIYHVIFYLFICYFFSHFSLYNNFYLFFKNGYLFHFIFKNYY